jgi:hypothetical protein
VAACSPIYRGMPIVLNAIDSRLCWRVGICVVIDCIDCDLRSHPGCSDQCRLGLPFLVKYEKESVKIHYPQYRLDSMSQFFSIRKTRIRQNKTKSNYNKGIDEFHNTQRSFGRRRDHVTYCGIVRCKCIASCDEQMPQTAYSAASTRESAMNKSRDTRHSKWLSIALRSATPCARQISQASPSTILLVYSPSTSKMCESCARQSVPASMGKCTSATSISPDEIHRAPAGMPCALSAHGHICKYGPSAWLPPSVG